jgi:very-long-chain (3R)-3-hydroxyacyl-CoA dehydratase
MILHQYPQELVRESIFVSSMVIAWCVTEIVRYGFYASNLVFGKAPYFLLWTRYTFFFVLYPMGAGSEFMLASIAKQFSVDEFGHYLFLTVICALYFPGFAYMYTHMIKQRKKYLSSKPKKE